jgi:hypothetical protein
MGKSDLRIAWNRIAIAEPTVRQLRHFVFAGITGVAVVADIAWLRSLPQMLRILLNPASRILNSIVGPALDISSPND